jgi:putative transposase
MLKAIKIRLYLNQEQVNYVNNLLGTSRFIYNNLLAYRIEKYDKDKRSVSFGELGKKLVELKSEHEWIKNSHSKVLQQSMINLDVAYKSFYKNGNGFPKFKSKKDNKQSCRFPSDAIGRIKGNRINIVKQLKDIHFKCSTKDEIFLNYNQKLIKSATLAKTKSNCYYLSILIEDNRTKQLPKTDNIIGLDLGIKDFIITSEGEVFENIKIRRNNQKKLVRLNRQLSKKTNGSKNKNKARIRLAKFHEKLNNKKENYLHLITNRLLNENQVIVIEDLNVKGMLKNHCLAKSIQELSLNRFKNILVYKCHWYGRDLVEIDRYYPSSKLCNYCGYKNDELTLKDREWVCPECKTHHDRDINAAINIGKEGKRILLIRENKINIGLSSPELTPLDSRGYTLDELGKECNYNEFM